MQTEEKRKKEGFKGQKAIIIPRKILKGLCLPDPVITGMYITDVGYYPNAEFHYREIPHGADQYILIYCHEGRGMATIDNTEYVIAPGEFFIVPIKTAHTYAANQINPWSIYWVHFKGQRASAMVSRVTSGDL
jgi:hypothetical protein